MKNFKLQTIALALFVSTALTSCSSDDSAPASSTKTAFVTAVTGATTATVNQEITLTAAFPVENNCGTFNKFVETKEGNTKTISVLAIYSGTNCGTTPVAKTAPYKFKEATAGTYNLKFKKSATEFVTHTVVVN